MGQLILHKVQLVAKRVADTILSLALLVCLLVPFAFICLAIVLDSPGSPFFVQIRVGRNGRRFAMLKFRSMYTDADQRLCDPGERAELEQSGRVLKLKQDPRVTRVGKILRTTSLDELPQVLNAFLGQMSLVGPRALIPSMVEPYPEWSKARHVMRPGITGLWQVSARERNESLEDMIEYDLQYIRAWSLLSDAVILIRTVGVVCSRKGAV